MLYCFGILFSSCSIFIEKALSCLKLLKHFFSELLFHFNVDVHLIVGILQNLLWLIDSGSYLIILVEGSVHASIVNLAGKQLLL